MAELDNKVADVPVIINLVKANDLSGMKNLLIMGASNIHEKDTDGMTALHHAAYKGLADMSRLLLDYGSDVNMDSHTFQYSVLHFAALSGNMDTVKLLLAAGAKPGAINSLKRSSAQMAGFVGHNDISATITNYVSMTEIAKYAKMEGASIIDADVVKPLHNFVLQTNFHPVHLALTAMKCPALLANMKQCSKVLESLRDKESKKPENVNEILAIKYHYLSYVLESFHTEYTKVLSKPETDEALPLQSVIKRLLKPRAADFYEEQIECFVRSAIKSFPFVEMPVFYPLVKNIAIEGDQSWALGSLQSAINGHRPFQEETSCATCNSVLKEPKKCSRCKKAPYCDGICQKLHWSAHKKFCTPAASPSG